MRRSIFTTLLFGGMLGLFVASCSDNQNPLEQTPEDGLASVAALFATSINLEKCMGDDAFAGGLTGGMGKAEDLNCTANDIYLARALPTRYSAVDPGDVPTAGDPLAPDQAIPCAAGSSFWVYTSAEVANNAQQRWDIGVWIATDGGIQAITGQCDHFTLTLGEPGVSDFDADYCGDMAAAEKGTPDPVTALNLEWIEVQCEVTKEVEGVGYAEVGACVGWQNSANKNVAARYCPFPAEGGTEADWRVATTPETKAKCNCEPLLIRVEPQGTVTIVKETVPEGDAQQFTFTPGGWNSDANFHLLHGGSKTSEFLSAGTYTVTETVPAGWDLTNRACVYNDTGDPKAFTPTANGVSVALGSGEHVTCTFTNTKKVSVTACKLEDVDRNPTTSDDRVPVEGWTVKLTKNGVVQDTKTTGENGCYTWDNLERLAAPNYYDVHEDVPADWFAWTPTSVNCTAGINGGACDATFVNSRKVSVKACKLEDVDTNPATAADRVAVAGWTVKLSKNGEVIDTKATGADGCYTWSNLDPLAPPNYYDVHEDVPADWFAWTPTSVNCTAGVNGGACDVTFVNSKKVSVKACKLEDVDGDPTSTTDRVPVEGWTVNLTKNGEVQDTKTTGADGCYTWSNLNPLAPPNYYDAHEVVPSDWYAWTPTSVNCDPIASGGTCTVTFVNSQYATKSGYKWNDLNGDGIWNDMGEPMLAGWTIEAWQGSTLVASVVTGTGDWPDGYYEFSLLPGSYTINEVCVAGWVQTFPAPTNGCGSGVYNITLASGQEDTDNNFGNWIPPQENDQTAWAANGDEPGYLRYVTQGNWATYVAYSGEAKTVNLYAGQTMLVGTVTFSAPANGEVTITINLTGAWAFFDDMGKDNLMVQDYATAPTGINPSPGLFAWKSFESGTLAEIVVPANSFYGVHAVVVGPPM